MKKLIKIASIASIAAIAGCGFLENKAEKVLGYDDSSMSGAIADLAEGAKMADKLTKLSIGEMMTVNKVCDATEAKLLKEWVPQLQAKAKTMGVESFEVTFNEDKSEGVLVFPDGNGKYSGVVQGTAKADGDTCEFVFRLTVTVANGTVEYEFK